MKEIIRETERAVLIENGRFRKILNPGKHSFNALFRKIEILKFNVVGEEAPEDIVDIIKLARPELAEQVFATVETSASEVAIVYINGMPKHIFRPWQKSAFWKIAAEVDAEIINTSGTLRVSEKHLKAMDTTNSSLVESATVQQYEAGLLFVDGEFTEELKPGRHVFWKVDRRIQIMKLDLRPQALEVTAQEILTKDRVSLRLTLTAFTKVTNPVKVTEETADHASYIYRLVQFAVREAVANRTLDEVLNDREAIDEQVRTYVKNQLGDIGIEINELGVKDIILPGDMRELINRVVEAEKVAQANLIKRREETAATRSLLNTAKLMENNPLLLRLKELEALERLTEKVGNIDLITGRTDSGFDGLLNNLLQLKKPSPNEEG